MFTIFHVFEVFGLVVGGLIGWRSGFHTGGLLFGVSGACIGITAGDMAGRLPEIVCVAALRRSLRRASTAELRSRLDREYFISHLLIAELVARGEPVESFRSVVAAQLQSASSDVRRFGEVNARRWFPDLASPSSSDGGFWAE